jgi:hypothetical protein
LREERKNSGAQARDSDGQRAEKLISGKKARRDERLHLCWQKRDEELRMERDGGRGLYSPCVTSFRSGLLLVPVDQLHLFLERIFSYGGARGGYKLGNHVHFEGCQH